MNIHLKKGLTIICFAGLITGYVACKTSYDQQSMLSASNCDMRSKPRADRQKSKFYIGLKLKSSKRGEQAPPAGLREKAELDSEYSSGGGVKPATGTEPGSSTESIADDKPDVRPERRSKPVIEEQAKPVADQNQKPRTRNPVERRIVKTTKTGIIFE